MLESKETITPNTTPSHWMLKEIMAMKKMARTMMMTVGLENVRTTCHMKTGAIMAKTPTTIRATQRKVLKVRVGRVEENGKEEDDDDDNKVDDDDDNDNDDDGGDENEDEEEVEDEDEEEKEDEEEEAL
ncbi:hypothetical protein F0562_003304 [Nyssa sinensis]|uniref:Uncharacterized protein n=1 Tax=Nyssa sinensis TaxID=561372 RepID=A0A5J5BV12_9ASTE|nr:hypothetical protein F0562_003304 [Nyssa sinensis]